MTLKNSIFDSKSEIKVLKQLRSTWTGKVGIYNHVPVANVVNIPNLSGYKKSQIEYLWKTNFDYVIASEEDKNFGEPLLIIEFDGLGEGYSLDGEYKQLRETEDPNRDWKLNFKSQICEESGVPLVIVSYPETELIDDKFTVIDGIVGEVLADRNFTERFNNEIHVLNKQLKDIQDPELRQHYIEMYGIEREVEEQIKNNPIAFESNRLRNLLIKNKILNTWGYSFSKDGFYISCEYFANLHNGIQLSEKAQIREVNCRGFESSSLVEEIAQLQLLRKIAKQHGLN
ncbi:DUF2726 domain-containing protein [Metabacillus sp. B2-18]|uniref:DUF2726 domain-containing protein n=1 Tax=Metabacillus sp. B2-18 TaxID=2897333 RepID=UPI001E62606A|nr:DUF2726 domain-containing protein [Metabacillus sp. B2-18]UGB30710.1 DUF2726 domain-containing protein [Metabacillus sp. B2-18]